MDKNKEIMKLEGKKLALQKKIDNLKKNTGQLQFEEWIRKRTYSIEENYTNESKTLKFKDFSIVIDCVLDKESLYKNLLIACEALERITVPTVTKG
jgi:hypothetical protein